jgi:hypothetical protein
VKTDLKNFSIIDSQRIEIKNQDINTHGKDDQSISLYKDEKNSPVSN